MKTYLFIVILFFSEIIAAAGTKQPAVAKAMAGEASSSQFGFIENKGQIIDQDNKPNPGLLVFIQWRWTACAVESEQFQL